MTPFPHDAQLREQPIRIVFFDTYGALALKELQEIASSLPALFALAGEVPPILIFEHDERKSNLRATREYFTESAGVLRITYASPLEIVLVLGSAGTALLALANRWADTRSRLAQSHTAVAREQLRYEATELLSDYVRRKRFADDEHASASELEAATEQAALLLSRIDRFVKEGDVTGIS